MKKRNVVLTVLFLMIAGGLAWAFLPAGPDPNVAKVVELQEKLFSEDAPRENRREAFGELREAMEKLTPEQRDQVMRDHPPPFMRQMQQNIVAFFDLSAAEQKKALDKQIDEMEQRRKEWEKRRAERGNRGDRPGPPGGRGGFGRGGDPSQQNERRKRMLDNTTPQQRAMFSEYFDRLQQRRQERGLPPMPGPGRGPR